MAGGLAGARDAVAMGVVPASGAMSAQVRAAVIEASGQAFVNGVHAAVLVTGASCVAGAVLAVVGVRHRPAH